MIGAVSSATPLGVAEIQADSATRITHVLTMSSKKSIAIYLKHYEDVSLIKDDEMILYKNLIYSYDEIKIIFVIFGIMNIYVVVVAGGAGTRMGSDIPKQFLPLGNVPILIRTLRVFANWACKPSIVLVIPAIHRAYVASLIQEYSPMANIQLVEGGPTRYHSVQNGLLAIPNKEAWVMVHDAVRPCITHRWLDSLLADAQQYGSAIPAVPVKDSMRRLLDTGSAVVDRSRIVSVQTPQVFSLPLLQEAFRQAYADSFTDEATVYEACGHPVHLSQGSVYNIKITTPEDMIIAEVYLAKGIE